MGDMFRACCLILCLVPGSWQLSITELVVPLGVEANSDAELQCRYEMSAGESERGLIVKWWWIPPPDSGRDTKQLYQRIAGRPAESMHHNMVIKDNTSDTIQLLDMKPMNSGIYECEVSYIDEVRKHGELIVYTKGSGPRVNVTVVEDGPDDDDGPDYLIECEAEEVAPKPELVITIGGDVLDITETLNMSDTGLYSILGSVTASGLVVEGSEIRCEMFYNSSFTHQPFEDKLFVYAAGDATISEVPAVVTDADVTPDSLQTLRDYGSPLQCSWTLLAAVTLITKMLSL